MHFTSFRAVAIDDINNHVTKGIKVLAAGDGSPVTLIEFSSCLLFFRRIPPSPPEEPDRLPEALLVVDQCSSHGLLFGENCGIQLLPFAVAQAVEFLNHPVFFAL